MKLNVRLRYINPWIGCDVLFGRASLRHAMRNGKIDNAAEIGVQAAINSKTILRRAKPKRMVCADPYEGYSKELDMTCDAIERIAHKRLSRYRMVQWIRSGDREKIAQAIGTEQMDYLYIDALHDTESVAADIRAYFPCVRSGGMLAGHDIIWPSVFRAVATFALENDLDVSANGTDWWIVK